MRSSFIPSGMRNCVNPIALCSAILFIILNFLILLREIAKITIFLVKDDFIKKDEKDSYEFQSYSF